MAYVEFDFIKQDTKRMNAEQRAETLECLIDARDSLLRHAQAIHESEEDAVPMALSYLTRIIRRYAEQPPRIAAGMAMMHLEALIEYADRDILELERMNDENE